MAGDAPPARKLMSGIKHLALDPAHVKLIELIAGMTAESRHPEVISGPPVGCEVSTEEVRAVPDHSMWDGAGEAHPAWRRGRDHGVEATAAAVNWVLDEIERGAVFTGRFEDASLEALKNRLRLMMAHRL